MAVTGKKTKKTKQKQKQQQQQQQKKTIIKMSQGKLRMKHPPWVNHNTEKKKKTVMFNSYSTLLIFLKQIFI